MNIPRIACLALVVGLLICYGCGENSVEEAVGDMPHSDRDSVAPPARGQAELAAEAALLSESDPEPAEIEGGATDELPQAEKAAEGVGKVCECLLKQIQEKPSITIRDAESFCFWSERLLQAQMWTSTLRARQHVAYKLNRANLIAGFLNDAFDAHIARLKQVAKIIKARAADGEADAVAVSAAESLILLAERQRAGYFATQRIAEEREMEMVLPDASDYQPLVQ